MKVKQAVERLMQQLSGAHGWVLMGEGQDMYVLVRREDLELLLATWGEKNK